MTQNPFIPIASMASTQARIVETLGVPYADPFNEEAVVADVNDPKKLGRVKVRTDDQLVSDWIPVSGSNSGTLSARFIGSRVLVGKTNGRSENMYVVGMVRNDPDAGVTGNPLQLPIIDESMEVWNGSTDSGMGCNRGNEGRMYILSNEMNQDVVVCLRRTSNQVGNKPSWAWKSITNGLWVEKGINPGNETTPAVSQSQKNNPGIPECSEALLGEVHEFTEDRGFRTTTMVCRRDENKNFTWMPLSAPPVFFRTTLPNCTEKVHGMEAILDDGNNSEFMVCQRYQGLMKWVRQGRRIPQKFYGKEKPLSRLEFTESFRDISALEEQDPQLIANERNRERNIDLMLLRGLQRGDYGTGPNIDRQIREIQENLLRNTPGGLPLASQPDTNYDWVAGISDTVFDSALSSIPLTGTDPRLKALLETASLIPATAFDGAETVQRVAIGSLLARTGVPVETLTQLIREELDENGELTPATAQVLTGIGAAADVLVNGVLGGDIPGALVSIGTNTLRNALLSLEPKAAAVMTGLMSGGIAGAVDTAVALGLDQLPPEVNKYVTPVIGIAKNILLSSYPASLGNILNSAAGGGLIGAVTSSINIAAGNNVVTPQLLEDVVTGLASGGLGEIPKLFSSLSGLDQIVKMPEGLGSLPVLATTALGVLGQVDSMTKLLGGGGIGIEQLNGLVGGGFNAATTIIGGIKGLQGVIGGVSGSASDCPCGPKCRKTAQGEDSDGNNLLEKCGALTANNTNSYAPVGVPVPNNTGPVAEDQKLTDTKVGSELIPSNRIDLTKMVEEVSRVKEMAEKYHLSRFADLTEKEAELAYTFEAVEKSLKTADNNITRVESVERKLIDSVYNLLNNIVYKRGGATLPDLINDARENAQAIRDLYKFVKRLDQVKDGGRAGVRVTSNLANSFANIPGLAKLNRRNRAEALRILRGGVVPADREWRSMTPGIDFGSKLGVYGPAIPSPYPSERTLFDKDRVMAISLESKLGDDLPQETTLLETVLSPDQVTRLKAVGAVSGEELGSRLLNGETATGDDLTNLPDIGESKLYDAIVGREGRTDCE